MSKVPVYLRTCNFCRQLITSNKMTINITSCKHLLCNFCVKKCLDNHCIICRTKCKVMQLTGKNVHEDISMLFRPLQEIQNELEKWLDFHQIHMQAINAKFNQQQKIDKKLTMAIEGAQKKYLAKKVKAIRRFNEAKQRLLKDGKIL